MRYRTCKSCGRRFILGERSKATYCSRICRSRSMSSNPNRHYKSGVYLTKSGRRERFDSGFEERHMLFLDQKGVQWTRANHIRIPYWNPRLRRQALYEPDFLIKGSQGYVIQELKPYSMVNDQVVQAKAEAARKWCREHGYSYEIICSPGQY